MQRELKRLASSGLVTVKRIGNQRHYQANPDAPVYEELCGRPQEVVEELFDYMGLEMTAQTSSFIERSSAGKPEEVKYFDVTRNSSKAATGWIKELNASQIEGIRRLVSPSTVGKLYFP